MNTDLTLEEQATNSQTLMHIMRVRTLLESFAVGLMERGRDHDQSKLQRPEVELFTEFTPKLAGCTYGSEEYKGYLGQMSAALQHHYAKNRHHPEFHVNGVKSMNLLDVVEMLFDWVAASERHHDGNPERSVKMNQQRFGISDELTGILLNTLKEFQL